MTRHTDFENNEKGKLQLRNLIATGKITLGGNLSLKIYGTLKCRSGKRLKRTNRVFFESEEEAIASGFRPCGNCMREKHTKIKR